MMDVKSHTLLEVFLIVGVSTLYAKACFPSKYWMSCLLDTCKLGGRCPGDPTAECRMEKTKCDGCKPVWYAKSGQKANCGVERNLKLCPGGEAVLHCKVNSCKWPCSHPDFRSVQCRQGYCGACAAEYFVKEKWMRCPSSSAETLPHDKVLGDSCQQVSCPIEVCIGERCPAVPKAVCRPDGCNVCRATWFLDNMPVDCLTGDIINNKKLFRPLTSSSAEVIAPWQRECAPGESYKPCDMAVCGTKSCRNFPTAECRPDGCGGCKDTWYLNNQLVDCLSNECPPNVPVVKCVDDPCKYFQHYCPAAECRASQCGKCEAKFFVRGQEIDCAMPPKVCPAEVETKACPWYTCPSNICPSDTRLMCRIDPCGSQCDYEFIDIYNEEPMLCRVFDGDNSRKALRLLEKQRQANKTMSTTIPAMQPLVINAGARSKSAVQQTKPLTVDPALINANPPIAETNLRTLLDAFPHEVAVIPSATIKAALKTDRANPLADVRTFEAETNNVIAEPRALSDNIKSPFPKQVVASPAPAIKQAKINEQTDVLPEVVQPNTFGLQNEASIDKIISAMESAQVQNIFRKPQAPQLPVTVVTSTTIPMLPVKITNANLFELKSRPISVPKGFGVPISMQMFSQWAMQ